MSDDLDSLVSTASAIFDQVDQELKRLRTRRRHRQQESVSRKRLKSELALIHRLETKLSETRDEVERELQQKGERL